jgi:hypothetical protein
VRSGGGSSITTIGASRSCDWQIHASGVAPHALSIAFMDDVLHAVAGPDAYVTVNGYPLSEAWHKVEALAVIRFGEAQLEVRWDDLCLERVTWPDVQRFRAAPHAPVGDARLPSLLEAGAEPRGRTSLLRLTGLALFAAISYFAWLVILDHV